MSLARVHNFSIALDGFGTGAGQSADAHFGHAGDRLHQWMFATRWWQPGGSGGVDDAFVQPHDPGIGAEIMGAGKWGHPGWHEDPQWKGAWGPNPLLLGAASGPLTVASGPSSARWSASDRGPGPARAPTVARAVEQLTLRIRGKEGRCRA